MTDISNQAEHDKPQAEGASTDYEAMRNEALTEGAERPAEDAEVFDAILAAQDRVYRQPATFGESPKTPSPNRPFYVVGTPGPGPGVIRPHYNATATINPDTKAWTFNAQHRITNSPTEEWPKFVTVHSTGDDILVVRGSAPSNRQLGKEGESSTSRLSWKDPEQRERVESYLHHVNATLAGDEYLQDWM